MFKKFDLGSNDLYLSSNDLYLVKYLNLGTDIYTYLQMIYT